jgi:putative redox protein
VKTASAHWVEGLRFDSRLPDVSVRLDSAGDPGDPSPTHLLLGALAACTGMDVISILQKKRQVVHAYTVHATGEQFESHPRAFREIDVEHVFEGSPLGIAAVLRAIELSARKYCPVNATISAGETRVRHRYRVRESAMEHTGEACTTGPGGAGLVPRD